jgi:hypothetical protein
MFFFDQIGRGFYENLFSDQPKHSAPFNFTLAGFLAGPVFLLSLILLDPRPSSTSGMGLIFVPFAVVPGAALGFILGFTAWSLSKLLDRDWSLPTFPCLVAGIAFGVAASASVIGLHEFTSRPRVISTNGEIVRLSRIPAELHDIRNAKLVYDFGDDEETVEWNNKAVHIRISDTFIELTGQGLADPISSEIDSDEYVTEVYALTVPLTGGDSDVLALFINLRSSSERALLLVFDHSEGLIYQEMLKRQRFENMRCGTDSNGRYILTIDMREPTAWSGS